MAVKLGEGYVPVGLRYAGFSQQLATVQRIFQGAMSKMDAISRNAKWVGLIGGGAMAVAVRSAASFEQGMARVKALTGATGSEFDALSSKAKELGRTTMFSARQSAEAMSFLALAGFDANKIIASMAPTLDLAAAGQMDVAQAADIVAKIMAGMGLEAKDLSEVVDVLAKAFTTSNTDLTQLGEALKYVGPVGKAAGYDLAELVSAIQVMSDAGIQGSLAGTSLRNIITRLSGAAPQANKVFKELGVQMLTAGGGMRRLADVVGDLQGKVTSINPLMTAFGQRAGPAMATLLAKGGDGLQAMKDNLSDVGGTAKRISEVQLEGFYGSLTKLKSAVEGLKIAFGEDLLGALTKYAEKLTEVSARTAESDELTRKQILSYVELAARWTALLYLAPKLMKAFAGIGAMLGAAGGPAGAVLGAVSALAAMSWAEAAASGRDYGDVLQDNIKKMLRLRDAQREIMDDQAKLKAGEEAAAKAREVAREKGVGSQEAVSAAQAAVQAAQGGLGRVQQDRKKAVQAAVQVAVDHFRLFGEKNVVQDAYRWLDRTITDTAEEANRALWGWAGRKPKPFYRPPPSELDEQIQGVMKKHDPLVATAQTRLREAQRNLLRQQQLAGARRLGGAATGLFAGQGQAFRDLRSIAGASGRGAMQMWQFQQFMQSIPGMAGRIGGAISGGVGGWYQKNRGQIGAGLMGQKPPGIPQFMGAAQYSRYVQQGSAERLDKTRNQLLKDGNAFMEGVERGISELPGKIRDLMGLG